MRCIFYLQAEASAGGILSFLVNITVYTALAYLNCGMYVMFVAGFCP